MAKGIAILALALTGLALTSCSKKAPDQSTAYSPPVAEGYAVENTKFKNCHFKVAAPTYSVNAAIAPNAIQCDEGVAKKVEVLSTSALPAGLTFSMGTLSLVGTPTEKVTNAPFDFYIENEAGYLILHMALTVK
jgi:hypothetical protein